MISLLLLSLLAQTSDTRIVRPERLNGSRASGRTGGAAYAFFEAFPASGAGTTTACSTTAPTGAKGEALTFTRGSTGTCTKTATGGLATTGIANGDLVVLSSNVARVEYDSAGTLGLLVESSQTNSCLRTEEFENAAWSTAVTAGAVTVTANAGTAPTNAATADRIQVAACPTVTQQSMVFQTTALATAATHSVYLRGFSGSGSVTLCASNGVSGVCSTCNFVSTAWSRCAISHTAGTQTLTLGCNNATAFYSGGGNTGAADFLAYGAQVEGTAYATSYIPTTSAAVTRSADSAYFTTSLSTAAGFSHAHSFTLESTENFTGAMGLYADATNRTQLYQSGGNSMTADYFSTSGNRSAIAAPVSWVPVTTTYRFALSYSGAGASSTVSTYLAGALQNTSATGLTSTWTGTQYGLGLNSPWNTGVSIYSRLCLDPSPTRCR